MTDKERLEFVKNSIDKVKKLWGSDEYMKGDEIYISLVSEFDWLIQQAERVQVLESRLAFEQGVTSNLQSKNKRYREALINALDELECSMRVGEHELEAMGIINKALEGEE